MFSILLLSNMQLLFSILLLLISCYYLSMQLLFSILLLLISCYYLSMQLLFSILLLRFYYLLILFISVIDKGQLSQNTKPQYTFPCRGVIVIENFFVIVNNSWDLYAMISFFVTFSTNEAGHLWGGQNHPIICFLLIVLHIPFDLFV